MYIHGRRRRNFIKTLTEYNKNYLHLTLRSYKPLMAVKNSEPLWLSFSYKFLTYMSYTLRTYEFIGFS